MKRCVCLPTRYNRRHRGEVGITQLGCNGAVADRKDRLMEPRAPNVVVRLEFELLEDRLVPGTLVVTPVGLHGDAYIHFLPPQPNVGLTNAQGHTPGVVHWIPGT